MLGDEEGFKGMQGEAPWSEVQSGSRNKSSQAHVKQGSICYVLGGLQAKCCGDSKEREITFDLFFTTGILVVFLLVPLMW